MVIDGARVVLEGEVGFALAPDHRVALIHTQLRKQRGPGEVDRLRDDDVAAGRCVCIARFMLDLRSESSSLCEEWTRQSYLIAYCCGRARVSIGEGDCERASFILL